MKKIIFIAITLINVSLVFGQLNDSLIYLDLLSRKENAIVGFEFVEQVKNLSIPEREKAVAKEILAGNVPSFSRKLKAIDFTKVINNKIYNIKFFTTCDYLAIGSDEDYLYIPTTPSTAQFLANKLNTILPTKKLVDLIYNNAETKLTPQPIPPSDKMTTIPVFFQHTDSIKKQIEELSLDRSSNNIIAGHKKDIIISNKIYNRTRNFDPVVIYGWHRSVNNPIQPVYNGHNSMYADYSHGVRLIYNYAIVNDDTLSIKDILQNSELANLFSDEGVITKTYYPDSEFLTSLNENNYSYPKDFILQQNYPNPFNPVTTINYTIPVGQDLILTYKVMLKVYDILGKEVATLVNGLQKTGFHTIEFNAENLPSGIYYYRMTTNNFAETKKFVLLK